LNTESNKALKKTGTINNWQQIIIMSNDKQECYSKRLNCDCPTLARVKYLCDYGTDSCNPVCLDIKGAASDVLTRTFLLLQ
jgi:hypothetical protein